jgi:hypothetical protein
MTDTKRAYLGVDLHGISPSTYASWKRGCSRLEVGELRRIKELEVGQFRRKRMCADLTL